MVFVRVFVRIVRRMEDWAVGGGRWAVARLADGSMA